MPFAPKHRVSDKNMTECSENIHNHGEQYPDCTANQPSELVYIITEVCTETSGGSDNPWDPNFPDLPGGGGGGEGGGSTTPCNGNGVLTGPQTPVSGIGYDSGDGCTGIPTSPNLGSPQTPCEKTKNLVNKPQIKTKLTSLQSYANTNTKIEDGFQELKSGTLVNGVVNGDNQIEFGIGSNSQGTVHTHQPGTIGIFAPQDIMTFLHIVNAQDANALGNAYSGTISSSGTYFINFTGTASDLPPAMTEAQEQAYVAQLVEIYKSWEDFLSQDDRYSTNNLKVNKPLGLEILLFKLLKQMNLDDKIKLIKEDGGNTSTIKENPDGTTTPNPC